MLEAKPTGLFSQDFGIEAEGRQIALLDVAFWKEAGAISIEGRPYKLYRENLISGAFVLEEEGRAVARASKPSAFHAHFDLELQTGRYSLKRDSAFRKSFSVLHGEIVIGSIRPSGVFTRRALIDLPEGWSIPAQVFVFWLALVIWNRDESGGVAAAMTATS